MKRKRNKPTETVPKEKRMLDQDVKVTVLNISMNQKKFSNKAKY